MRAFPLSQNGACGRICRICDAKFTLNLKFAPKKAKALQLRLEIVAAQEREEQLNNYLRDKHRQTIELSCNLAK